jgi:hypothetical protein
MTQYIKYQINRLFEKLHRYIFDYYFQSENADFGLPTRYKKANQNNKFERFNSLIYFFYKTLCPLFKGWRKQLKIYSESKVSKWELENKKYKRYELI